MRWLIPILALGFIVVATDATALILRSCKGELVRIKPLSIATIHGEGTCKNKLKANECRARARAAIVACSKALFAVRAESTALPANCSGLGAALSWNQIIKGIRGNNLGDRVRWNQCCQRQGNTIGEFLVTVTVTGDRGCGGSKIGDNLFQSEIPIGTIRFDCQEDRMKLCPPQRAAPKPPPRAGSD